MATSEHGDNVEIAASVWHHSGKPPLEPAIQETAPQASRSTVLGSSDNTTRERESPSINQISGVCLQLSCINAVELDIIPSEYFHAEDD